MPTRSARLSGPIALAAGVNEFLQGDGTQVLLIKQLAVINNSGSNRTAGLYVNGNANSNRVWRRELLPAENLLLAGLFIVLNPDDVLWAEATATGPVLSLFGAVLTDNGF